MTTRMGEGTSPWRSFSSWWEASPIRATGVSRDGHTQRLCTEATARMLASPAAPARFPLHVDQIALRSGLPPPIAGVGDAAAQPARRLVRALRRPAGPLAARAGARRGPPVIGPA